MFRSNLITIGEDHQRCGDHSRPSRVRPRPFLRYPNASEKIANTGTFIANPMSTTSTSRIMAIVYMRGRLSHRGARSTDCSRRY
jgi:hypothetical protein